MRAEEGGLGLVGGLGASLRRFDFQLSCALRAEISARKR